MVGGTGLLTLNDAIMKSLTVDYPVGEIMAVRGLFVFIPIAFLAHRAGGLASLRIVSRKGQAARAVLVVTSTFMFVTGLGYLPLADIIAITFAGPLFLTALAAAVLGERVGWRRWTAVVLGFVGILIITRPTGNGLGWVVLLPLGAVLCGVARDLITRRISARESSVAILATTTAAVTLAGFATLPFGWRTPTPTDVALLALTGLLLGAAHFLLIETFRLAEAVVVAPFRYTSMIWAIVFGFLFFATLPDMWVIAGAALVVASGLYIFHRERRRGPSIGSVPR